MVHTAPLFPLITDTLYEDCNASHEQRKLPPLRLKISAKLCIVLKRVLARRAVHAVVLAHFCTVKQMLFLRKGKNVIFSPFFVQKYALHTQ